MTQATHVLEALFKNRNVQRSVLSAIINTPEKQWPTSFPGVEPRAIRQFVQELPQSENDLDLIQRVSVAMMVLLAKNPERNIVSDLGDPTKRAEIAQGLELPVRDLTAFYEQVLQPAQQESGISGRAETYAGSGNRDRTASTTGYRF